MKKSLENFIRFTFGCLFFLILSCGSASNEAFFFQPVDNGNSQDPESSPSNWQSPQQGQSLFPMGLVMIFIPGSQILSFNAGAQDAQLSQSLGLEVNFSGETAILRPSDAWPFGENTLSFSAETTLGRVAGEIGFNVDFSPPLPGQDIPGCSHPLGPATPTGKIVFFQDLGGNIRELFVLDPQNPEATLQQITADNLWVNQSPNLDHDAQVSFSSNRTDASDDSSDTEIYRVSLDGRELCQVTENYTVNGSPSLNPQNLNEVAYSCAPSRICKTNLQTHAETILVGKNGLNNGVPKWCGNDQLVYLSSGQIYKVNGNGSNSQTVPGTPSGVGGELGCCSNHGVTQVLYSHEEMLYTANLDSGQLTLLVPGREGSFNQDCSQITFVRPMPLQGTQIFTIASDGSQETQITHFPGFKGSPSWY